MKGRRGDVEFLQFGRRRCGRGDHAPRAGQPVGRNLFPGYALPRGGELLRLGKLQRVHHRRGDAGVARRRAQAAGGGGPGQPAPPSPAPLQGRGGLELDRQPERAPAGEAGGLRNPPGQPARQGALPAGEHPRRSQDGSRDHGAQDVPRRSLGVRHRDDLPGRGHRRASRARPRARRRLDRGAGDRFPVLGEHRRVACLGVWYWESGHPDSQSGP